MDILIHKSKGRIRVWWGRGFVPDSAEQNTRPGGLHVVGTRLGKRVCGQEGLEGAVLIPSHP